MDPNSFQLYNKSFWYDIRYAEILLSYAEAVAESGQGDKAKAKQAYTTYLALQPQGSGAAQARTQLEKL